MSAHLEAFAEADQVVREHSGPCQMERVGRLVRLTLPIERLTTIPELSS